MVSRNIYCIFCYSKLKDIQQERNRLAKIHALCRRRSEVGQREASRWPPATSVFGEG